METIINPFTTTSTTSTENQEQQKPKEPQEQTPGGNGQTPKALKELLPVEKIPEKLREKSVDDLLTSFTWAEGKLGSRVNDFLGSDEGKSFLQESGYFSKPGENASPEERDAYLNTLGRPATADEYQLPETSEALPVNADYLKWYQQTAHKHGLTQEQFAAVAQENMLWQRNAIIKQQTDTKLFFTDKTNQSEEASVHGFKVDDKGNPAAYHSAQLALGQFPKELQEKVRTEAFYNPVVMRLLAWIGKDLKEDTAPGNTATTTVNKASLMKRKNEIDEKLRSNEIAGTSRESLIQERKQILHSLDRIDPNQ